MRIFKIKILIPAAALLLIAAMQFLLPACSPPAISFGDIVISEDIDKESGAPVDTGNEFDINIDKIVASVRYSGVRGADRWAFKWINLDLNQTVLDVSREFNGQNPDSFFQGTVSSDIFASDQSKIIAPGKYLVEFYFNDSLVKTSEFIIAKPKSGIIEVSLSDEIDEFGKPLNPSTKFKPHDTVYLSVKLDFAIAGNIIKAVWENSNQQIIEQAVSEIKTDYYDNSYLWFALPLKDKKYDIAPGFYNVKVFLNDLLYKSIKFEVLKADPPVFNEKNLYKNDLFGFFLNIPDNWTYEEKNENNTLYLQLIPDIETPALFIVASSAAGPLQPYDEFVKTDSDAIAASKKLQFIESVKRQYILKNTYPTTEYIRNYKDSSGNNYIIVYSITEYNNNALILNILIEDNTYNEFAEAAYAGIINSFSADLS
jgi:hypothetical protein